MIARQFEDLIMWQRARELCKLIYTYAKKAGFKTDFGLRDQIQRSIVSVMSNIAEGFGRGSNKEFVQYLFVAKGSLSEVQSQLYVALDQKYMHKETFERLYDKAEKVARMTSNFIKYLNESERNKRR